jgi:hypothetical protein
MMICISFILNFSNRYYFIKLIITILQ